MKKNRILIILLSILFINPIFSNKIIEKNQKKWYMPDYAKLQFAGNIGFFSIGIGYTFFNGLLASDLLYGYVPEFIANTKIHTITKKNTFSFLNKNIKNYILSPITGFTISYETGNNSFLLLPDRYPEGYYFTNAFHSTFFLGGKIHKNFDPKSKIKGIDFYIELGTVDLYLYYFFLSKELKIYDIFSLALGVNIHI